ncbi:MAG: AzlD family protein [Aestuariivirga sp.]
MIDGPTLLAIVGMALATYATRVSGYLLLGGVTVRGRLKAALDALPPAILVSVIAPTVVATGLAESIAAAITIAAAVLRLPMIAVVAIGVVSVVALRAVIG